MSLSVVEDIMSLDIIIIPVVVEKSENFVHLGSQMDHIRNMPHPIDCMVCLI